VFEAKKQVGLEGLSKEIQEALKGVEGEPGEIVERIKSLAESKADEVRGSLDQMHAVLQQEGGKINTEVSGISEAIQSLNDDTREKVQEALERFQIKLAQAVKDIEVDVLDKEIEILQDRVDDLERKKKQNEKDKGEPPLSPEEEVELVAKQAEVDQLEAKSRKLAGKPEGTAPSPDTSVSTATPVVAEAVKAPGVSASFAEAARKIQEKNAAEAEAKLGSFIDGLIEKARKERTKHATVFSGSEAQQKIAADRFEADKSILSARHLLHFVEGDKRTRRVDADDPSGEDELVVYQAAPSGFSEKGVLNLARNKFGYSGEDANVLESIRKKAGEQLSNEKEGGTGDFAQGVAAVEKRVEGREELERIKQELDSFGADPSDREKERIKIKRSKRYTLNQSHESIS
jgi:cob(I)alamin adenosyltransferase